MVWGRSPVVCRSCFLVGAGDGLVSPGHQYWALTCCLCMDFTLCWIVLDLLCLSPLICGIYLRVWFCASWCRQVFHKRYVFFVKFPAKIHQVRVQRLYESLIKRYFIFILCVYCALCYLLYQCFHFLCYSVKYHGMAPWVATTVASKTHCY